jgi:hypothetical protein
MWSKLLSQHEAILILCVEARFVLPMHQSGETMTPLSNQKVGFRPGVCLPEGSMPLGRSTFNHKLTQ